MLREIRTFLAVVRRGTFAAAGEQIGLTQSAVSSQIKQLEEVLGLTLFDRTARSASLNAAGLRAIPIAEEMLALFQVMGSADGLEVHRGELRIGAIGTVQTGVLPNALLRLRDKAPGIDVKLVPGVSIDLLSQLDAGTLDMAIMIRSPFALPKEFHSTLVAKEAYVLITPLEMAQDDLFTLLATQPFVRYDRVSFGGRLVSNFLREHKIQVNQVMELDELDAIVKMVHAGLGVSLVPQAGTWWQDNRESVNIIDLGEHTFHRDIILIERLAQRQQPLASIFRSCLDV